MFKTEIFINFGVFFVGNCYQDTVPCDTLRYCHTTCDTFRCSNTVPKINKILRPCDNFWLYEHGWCHFQLRTSSMVPFITGTGGDEGPIFPFHIHSENKTCSKGSSLTVTFLRKHSTLLKKHIVQPIEMSESQTSLGTRNV